MPSSRATAAVVALALWTTGCLFEQRREMVEARAAYRECVRQHPSDAQRACAELAAEAAVKQDRYESDAQRAWGCGAADGPCDPTERVPSIPR